MGVRLDQLENVLSEKRWSQADLARRSGLSEHTIGRAVRNKEALSETSANKISRALGRGVESLNSASLETTGLQDTKYRHMDPRRLRDAMAASGMNPTELAKKTGLSVHRFVPAQRPTNAPATDHRQDKPGPRSRCRGLLPGGCE